MLVETVLNKIAFSEDFIVLTCSDVYSIQSSVMYYCITAFHFWFSSFVLIGFAHTFAQ